MDRMAQAERTISPAQILLGTAGYALEKAKQKDEGSLLEVVTALLMCALALEATLNHVGSFVFAGRDDDGSAVWSIVEWAKPRKKLEAIAESTGLRIDFGAEPFQHFDAIFKFRNLVAHGRTVTLRGQAPHADLMSMPLRRIEPFQTEWEAYCTYPTAEKWLEQVGLMTEVLCAAAECPPPIETATWSA